MTDATRVDAAVRITQTVSVKGRLQPADAWRIGDHVVVARGTWPIVARVFDLYWLEAAHLPDPRRIVQGLQALESPPDLFTFSQRVPETEPLYDYYHEWDNVAAIPISTHEHWMGKQISSASRRNVRASSKRGVTVRECPFDETYIRGIMSISNESPYRAGRRYWHYGKSFEAVEAEQGTYRERATYLGAFLDGEMIGYLKLVWDVRTAAIMQIVSTTRNRDARPNNALLSEAVRLCAERGVGHLLYERFVYGTNVDSSLTRFKRENGFIRMDVPTYYVPLTRRGRLALKLGLHHSPKDRLPRWLATALLGLRDRWSALRSRRALTS